MGKAHFRLLSPVIFGFYDFFQAEMFDFYVEMVSLSVFLSCFWVWYLT